MVMSSKKHVWQTIGHEKQKYFLEALLKKNQFSHAYLFLGPDHVGKTALALDFAKILVCQGDAQKPCGECFACKLPVGSNPDIALVEGDPISVAMIRKLQDDFALKSFHAGRRVAVISGAHRMNSEAANALLKFLEEPDASTIIILTAPTQGLPETILSRVQKIFFSPVDDGKIKNFISGAKLPKNQLEHLLAAAHGRPGIARQAEGDEEFRNNWMVEEKTFNELLEASLPDRLTWSSELAGRETPELKNLFSHWLMIAEAGLLASRDDSFVATRGRLLRTILSAMEGLEFNANKKLLLDNFVINLP
jgi:DNA polymerase III subunit delta'